MASVADGRCSGSGFSKRPRNSRMSLAPSTPASASTTGHGLGMLPPPPSTGATEGADGSMASSCTSAPGVAGRNTWPSGVKNSSRLGCLATRLSGNGPKKSTRDTRIRGSSMLLASAHEVMLLTRLRMMTSQSVTASCQTSTFSVTGRPSKASGGVVVPVAFAPDSVSSLTLLALSRLDSFQAPSWARQTVKGETPQCAQPCA
mmetsp:Transcript_39153/g.118293  ORF Transcript_39153/g.118293 Transcript_39153/m.118293 type:complete len:203 (+) Transcript_39153:958-1566(+)